MKRKKVLALIMGAIIAASVTSQTVVQVYAHDEESISSSKHMKDGSDAEKLYKLPNFTRRSVERFLKRRTSEIEDLSNLYISPTSRLVFKPGLNQEAKLVGLAEKVNFIGDIVIPEKVSINGETYSVTSIGNAAFRGYKYIQLKSLPKSLKIIGERAFVNCVRLQLGELPEGLEIIGENTFESCGKLNLRALPTNLREIGNGAFIYCRSLELRELPKNLCKIGNDAFASTSIKTITIPASVTELGNSAFDTYSIERIDLSQESILNNDDIERAYGEQLRIIGQRIFTPVELSDEVAEKKCPICRENFKEENGEVGGLPCGHYIHLDCFDGVRFDFRQGNRTFKCPVCEKEYNI